MNKFLCCCFAFLAAPSFLRAQPCSLTVVPTAYSVCPGYQATITAFGASSYTWTGTTFSAPVNAQSVTVGPGSYTVAGDTHTCTASILIGSQMPLLIQITLSSATTCIQSNSPVLSKPVVLNASGAGSYTWAPSLSLSPQLTVRPDANTCYTVVGATSACSGSNMVCVSVVPQFTIAANPQSASICAGEAVSLSVSQVGAGAAGPPSAFSYNWTDMDTSFSANVNTTITVPAGSTVYTVTVFDAEGCVSIPATVSITVDPCTVIPERVHDQLTFFPNPFNDRLDLKGSDVMVITISDVTGRDLLVIKPGREKELSFDTSQLSPGIYWVTVVNSARRTSMARLIKQ